MKRMKYFGLTYCDWQMKNKLGAGPVDRYRKDIKNNRIARTFLLVSKNELIFNYIQNKLNFDDAERLLLCANLG